MIRGTGIGLWGVLALVLGGVPLLALGQTPEPPDILFISIDDMNDWVSPLDGHPQAITPNMERLAERGIVFTNAHSPAALCNPSRTAFLTGLRPSTTGVYGNGNDWETNDVANSVRMLPGYFMDSGYRVMGGGKIFHSGHNDRSSWHGYYPSFDHTRPHETVPIGSVPANNNPFNNNNPSNSFDWGPIVAEDSATSDGQLADWMARRLNEPSDGPRFDAVGFRRPHQPWFVPQKYFDMHPLENVVLPPIVENDLGDVPDASGRADNTIIVVFGDHGYHVGEKSSYAKRTLWRESTRVAMFIVAPGVTRPGTRTDAPVNLLDIYPTLTELAGLPAPDHVEGTSLVPLLANPDADWDRPTLTTNGYGNHAITSDRYRYIRWIDGSEELYDFVADPHEFTNLAGDPGMQAFKDDLAAWFPEESAPDTELGLGL